MKENLYKENGCGLVAATLFYHPKAKERQNSGAFLILNSDNSLGKLTISLIG
jgi:hypothetical protein